MEHYYGSLVDVHLHLIKRKTNRRLCYGKVYEWRELII